MITPQQVDHLRELLQQGEAWVGRARWIRWLNDADPTDVMPIEDMGNDDRIAACAWLRQQRHVLYSTVEDGGDRAPRGWVEELPLYRGLCLHE